MNAKDLEKFLLAKIPLANALAIKVVKADDSQVEISAPLKPNVNHLGTAFGGSLQSVMVLACYSWLFNLLESRGISAHVILKTINSKFTSPVEGNFSAICPAPPNKAIEKFLKTVGQRKRGQISLKATIERAGDVACELEGKFVAVRTDIYDTLRN